MKRSLVGAVVLGALVLVAVAAAAPIVASPGPSPFSPTGIHPCGNDDFAAEQQAQGSVLYPGSEIEPRRGSEATSSRSTSRTGGTTGAHVVSSQA